MEERPSRRMSAYANTGDPNGSVEACPLMRTHALISMMVRSKTAPTRDWIH
jgi:hypothetical protein